MALFTWQPTWADDCRALPNICSLRLLARLQPTYLLVLLLLFVLFVKFLLVFIKKVGVVNSCNKVTFWGQYDHLSYIFAQELFGQRNPKDELLTRFIISGAFERGLCQTIRNYIFMQTGLNTEINKSWLD